MTHSTLVSWLDNPSLIDIEGIDQLQKMVAQYPYSSIFHILLSKGLHNVGAIDLDTQLRKTAVAIPDRGILYQILYAQKLQDTIQKVSAGISNPLEENVQEEVESDDVPNIVETIEVPTIATSEKEKPIDKEKSALEEDILLEAINTSIQLDVDELLKEIEIENPIEERTTPSIESEEQEEEEKPVLNPQKFSDWLFSMKDKEATEVPKVDEKPKKLLSSRDLIDRFIAQKNKKITISEEPITPKELGQLSLVENEDFVTETLANIYAKQGKYDKAIKIFEQLMLNFPEKNTFFASRIRFLKEKMEYDK